MATPKLRFKEFHEDWPKTSFQNLFIFKNGINASKEQYGSGTKFINVLDIINNPNGITYDSIIGSVQVSQKDIDKNLVNYGDVVFQRSSETREEVGQSNVYLSKEPVVFGGFVIRGSAQVPYDPLFINGLLKTDKVRDQITQLSGGSTRFNIGQDSLNKVSVFLPLKEEQTKIASFLSAVGEKISQLSQKLQLLGQYKQGMMHKLFSQQIRFKADDGSEFEEWEERKLSEISQKAMYGMNAAATEYDGINKYLRITDICEFSNSFKMDNLTSPNAELDDKYKLQLGDLLFARTGASVGKSYLYKENDGITYFAGFLIKFSLNTNLVIPYFIFLQTLTKGFSQWVVTNSMRSGQPGINAEEYSSYIFKVPCLAEQTKIANFLSSIDQKIDVVSEQLEQAKLWKKGLLQQMFV